MSFHNIIVTKKVEDITINSLDDLKGLSIVTWEGASRDLGQEFADAVKNNDNYREIGNQHEQGSIFFQGGSQAIVIDKTIFEWWLKEYKGIFNTDQEFVYHDLFPEITRFYVGFKSKQQRDLFNKGLSQIKQNSIYQTVYSHYTGLN